MQITQADYRTVKIEQNSITILMRYSLYQNGEERLPESIACRGDHTVAYFLTSTIRDFLVPIEDGFSIVRSWSVIPEGELALYFCLDFPQLLAASYLLPGSARGDQASREGILADGCLTSFPNSVFLFTKERSVLIFSDPPHTEQERGSVELRRIVQEEEPFTRVEVRFPPAAPAPEAESFLHSAGGFEQTLRLNLLITPASEAPRRGIGAVLNRLAEKAPERLKATIDKNLPERTRQEINAALESLLVRRGGVCGVRTTARSPELSAYAGSGLALLLYRLFPNDYEMTELALELADFALKGQRPAGLFYERYDLERSSWLEKSGRREAAPCVQVEESAGTARFLLELAGALRRRGRQHAAYLHAATRATAALFASGRRLNDMACRLHPLTHEGLASGLGVLAIIAPLQELARLTGKDHYRKALSAFRDKLAAPPSAWEREPTNVSGALHLARSSVLLAEAGIADKNLDERFTALLPWIYLNRLPCKTPLNPTGGVLAALAERRLEFRGFELCYLLAKLDSLLPGKNTLHSLRGLPQQLLSFTLQRPAGTSFFSLTELSIGPLDGRVLVRELYYRLKLQEEFPELLEN